MTNTTTAKKPVNKIVLAAAGGGSLLVICLLCMLIGGLLPNSSSAPAAPTLSGTAIQQTAFAMVYESSTQTAIANIPTETVVPPTATLTPTQPPSPTPPPQPIMLSGQGDSVIDIQKWDGPALLKVSHNGGSNFAIWSDDARGEHIDLLVNTIGNYQGTLPLDFLDRELTARFEIKAGGQWSLQILPLENIRKQAIPDTIRGIGDDVIGFTGNASPDLLKVDASQADSNFVIHTFGAAGRDLVVNEIAPYTGIVAIDKNTFVIVVKATGSWSIEVTAR